MCVVGVLLTVGCMHATTAESPTWVFVLSGQSNMVGQGKTSELSDELKATPENVELCVSGRTTEFARQSTFGPELTFAHEMGKAFPKQRILLIKYASGGTSLFAWAPDWKREDAALTDNVSAGRLYENLMRYVQRCTEGRQTKFMGVLWMQGERDARFPAAGTIYEKNFRSFIERIREDLGARSLPFVYGIVNPPPENYPAAGEVREAQRILPEKMSHIKMVDTDDLSKWDDDLHYDTQGQIELGKRFAEAIFPFIESGTDRYRDFR